jgi:hypothetical protein
MTVDGEQERWPKASDPKARSSAGVRRTSRAGARSPGQDAFHIWGSAFESSIRRPAVVPADPAAPGQCLCGEPADFVIEMSWFSGRHSKDPVCGRHVDEVVRAIKKEQARRDGG